MSALTLTFFVIEEKPILLSFHLPTCVWSAPKWADKMETKLVFSKIAKNWLQLELTCKNNIFDTITQLL